MTLLFTIMGPTGSGGIKEKANISFYMHSSIWLKGILLNAIFHADIVLCAGQELVVSAPKGSSLIGYGIGYINFYSFANCPQFRGLFQRVELMSCLGGRKEETEKALLPETVKWQIRKLLHNRMHSFAEFPEVSSQRRMLMLCLYIQHTICKPTRLKMNVLDAKDRLLRLTCQCRIVE